MYFFTRLMAVISLLLLQFIVNAQEPCGTMQHRKMLLEQEPKTALIMEEIERHTEAFLANPQNYNAQRAVITIPVVVHVVYNTTAQNISDAQIQSQINRLNLDFRKLNPDWNNTPAAWNSLVADYNIEFCLAKRTPTGGATTGIIRRQTTVTSFTTDDKVKRNSSGGSDAWPSSQYLNIWVCNLGSNLLGYAQFPGGPSATDGIVVKHNVFGTTGTVAFPYNQGRTAVHEVGHWLNLFHVWGDDNGSCSGSDRVGDTPNQADLSSGCPTFPKTDACSPSSPGIMFMNYMNYSFDGCMYMFTNGQYARSSSLFGTNGFRAALKNSLGCVAPNSPPVANFTATPTNACPGQTVQFTNTSTGNITSYSWQFPGGTPATSTAQNPTVTYASVGTYNVTLTVSGPNGDNTKTSNAFITVSAPSSLPLVQGFETTPFPPPGWMVLNGDNSTTWGRTTSASGFGGSSACAFMDMYNYSVKGQTDWLITPAYDFTGVTSARVKWDYAYANVTTPGYYDTLMVYYSTNCGATWTQIWKRGGTQLATAPATAYAFIPTASQWRRDSVNLNNLSGQQNVKFAFVTNNQFGNYLFLDNVNIFTTSGQGSAPAVDFVGTPTTVVAGNTVSFTDLSANGPTSWNWTFTGGTPSSSTSQNPTITYNTPGVYPVSLTATNTNGSNSATKNSYITVIAPGTQTCDTLTNFVTGDTLTLYSFLPPNWGYLAGHNSLRDMAKAEYYANTSSRYIMGVFMRFGKATTNNPSGSVITVRAWSANGAGGSPGTVLASQTFLISTIRSDVAANRYTFVPFNTPPNVTGNFFVGFSMTYVAGDTVGLATSTFNSPIPNHGWEQKSNGSWYPYSDAVNSYGYKMDNMILPVLCTSTQMPPSASFTASGTAACPGKAIQFTSTSSGSPTSYSWTFPGGTPANSTASSVSVVFNTPGTKTISLTVSNGAGNSTAQGNLTIYPIPALTTSSTPVLCYDGSTGTATVNATGGSGFTYNWSGGGSSATITNKPSGTYNVTVTNSNLCSATAAVNIAQPLSPLGISISSNDAACGLPNGSAAVSASGGNGGFRYQWSTGDTSATIENLVPGVYAVTAYDVNQCSAITSTTIKNENTETIVNLNVVNDSCGLGEGFIAVAVFGTSTDTYLWNTGATTAYISNLRAGLYSVTVTRSNGCKDVAQVFLDDNSALQLSLSTQAPTGGNNNGSASVSVSGGVPPYTYSWSNGGTGATINNLPAGNYTVTVTDKTGCKKSDFVSVGNTTGMEESNMFRVFRIYPNPANEMLQVEIELTEFQGIDLRLVNQLGQQLWSNRLNEFQKGKQIIPLNGLPAGIYSVQVQLAGGVISQRFVKQ